LNDTEDGPAGGYREIRTLADLDDAIDRISDEEAGWGMTRVFPELGCAVTFDLAEPSTVKVRWDREPTPSDYRRLFPSVLPNFERRVDWCRAVTGGVWEVFRIPALRAS
jgi:hypothetical protein